MVCFDRPMMESGGGCAGYFPLRAKNESFCAAGKCIVILASSRRKAEEQSAALRAMREGGFVFAAHAGQSFEDDAENVHAVIKESEIHGWQN